MSNDAFGFFLFYFEFSNYKLVEVYEAILIAMEDYKNDLVANSMIWLLQYLYTKEVSFDNFWEQNLNLRWVNITIQIKV